MEMHVVVCRLLPHALSLLYDLVHQQPHLGNQQHHNNKTSRPGLKISAYRIHTGIRESMNGYSSRVVGQGSPPGLDDRKIRYTHLEVMMMHRRLSCHPDVPYECSFLQLSPLMAMNGLTTPTL